MPVSRMRVGKYSNHAIEREALADTGILIDIHVVIEIDEIVPQCLPEDRPDDCDQTEADVKMGESYGGAVSPMSRLSRCAGRATADRG